MSHATKVQWIAHAWPGLSKVKNPQEVVEQLMQNPDLMSLKVMHADGKNKVLRSTTIRGIRRWLEMEEDTLKKQPAIRKYIKMQSSRPIPSEEGKETRKEDSDLSPPVPRPEEPDFTKEPPKEDEFWYRATETGQPVNPLEDPLPTNVTETTPVTEVPGEGKRPIGTELAQHQELGPTAPIQLVMGGDSGGGTGYGSALSEARREFITRMGNAQDRVFREFSDTFLGSTNSDAAALRRFNEVLHDGQDRKLVTSDEAKALWAWKDQMQEVAGTVSREGFPRPEYLTMFPDLNLSDTTISGWSSKTPEQQSAMRSLLLQAANSQYQVGLDNYRLGHFAELIGHVNALGWTADEVSKALSLTGYTLGTGQDHNSFAYVDLLAHDDILLGQGITQAQLNDPHFRAQLSELQSLLRQTDDAVWRHATDDQTRRADAIADLFQRQGWMSRSSGGWHYTETGQKMWDLMSSALAYTGSRLAWDENQSVSGQGQWVLHNQQSERAQSQLQYWFNIASLGLLVVDPFMAVGEVEGAGTEAIAVETAESGETSTVRRMATDLTDALGDRVEEVEMTNLAPGSTEENQVENAFANKVKTILEAEGRSAEEAKSSLSNLLKPPALPPSVQDVDFQVELFQEGLSKREEEIEMVSLDKKAPAEPPEPVTRVNRSRLEEVARRGEANRVAREAKRAAEEAVRAKRAAEEAARAAQADAEDFAARFRNAVQDDVKRRDSEWVSYRESEEPDPAETLIRKRPVGGPSVLGDTGVLIPGRSNLLEEEVTYVARPGSRSYPIDFPHKSLWSRIGGDVSREEVSRKRRRLEHSRLHSISGGLSRAADDELLPVGLGPWITTYG